MGLILILWAVVSLQSAFLQETSQMAKAKAAANSRKTHAKDRGIRQRATASAETASLRAGLSFPIVAIGASAGGLAAFTALLKALPSKSGDGVRADSALGAQP